MKFPSVLPIVFFAVAIAHAQEPPLPSNSPAPSVAPAASETPAASVTPPPLIPAAPVEPVLPPAPTPPDLSQLDAAFKQTPLGQKAQEYRLHVEWRKLQNRVAGDPSLIAARQFAEKARTDLEKRERLRRYYKLYYERISAMADTPELKGYVEAQKVGHLGNTAQNRVRPSASPTPKPSATAATTPLESIPPPDLPAASPTPTPATSP